MEVGRLWAILGLDKKGYDKGLENARRQGEGLGSFLKGAFQFTVGQGIFDLIKTGINSVKTQGMEYNSVLQQNSIAFETMLGSASKAKTMLDDLQKFAAATPFEFPDLTTATKKMLAFGFSADQVMPTLKAVGDTAAGLGMSGAEGLDRIILALGQMRAKSKVQAGEMLQLTEAGVPAWDILAKAMNMTTAQVMKLSERGLIPADKAVQALVDGMEERFPNMMNKQSESFDGLMSTLKDNLNIVFGQVMKPAFDWLTNEGLPKAIDLVTKFQKGFQSGGFKGGLAEIMTPQQLQTLETATKAVAGFAAAWAGVKVIGGVIATLTGLWTIITSIGSVITAVGGFIGGIVEVFALWAGGAGTLGECLALLPGGPIAWVIAAVVALAGIVTYLWNTNEGFRNFVIECWNGIKNGVVSAVGGLGSFFSGLWAGIQSTSLAIWNGLLKFFTVDVPTGFNNMIRFFSELPGKVVAYLIDLFGTKIPYWIGYGIGYMITFLTTNIPKVIQFFMELPGKIKTWLDTAIPKVVEWAANLLVEAKKAASSFIGGLAMFLITLPQKMSTWLTDMAIAVSKKAVELYNGAKQIGQKIVDGIVDAVKALPETVANIISGVWNKVTETINGIKNALSNAWNSFTGGVSQGITDAKAAASKNTSTAPAKHAAGGIFTGPTLWGNNLIGEQGTEVLMPLDKLDSLIGGGGQPVTVQVVLDGRVIQEYTDRKLGGRSRRLGYSGV